MNRKYVVFGCSIIIGALIWASSPLIIGHTEPLDAEGIRGLYYPLAVFLPGVVCTFFSPPEFLLVSLGIFLGQIFYLLLFLSFGPPLFLGRIICSLYTVLAVLGAFLVNKILKMNNEAGTKET